VWCRKLSLALSPALTRKANHPQAFRAPDKPCRPQRFRPALRQELHGPPSGGRHLIRQTKVWIIGQMADPVEVAIESALLNRAQSYATSQSLTIALPNVITTPPVATPTAKWLQAFFLPAPTAGLGISPNSTNQHYGHLPDLRLLRAGRGRTRARPHRRRHHLVFQVWHRRHQGRLHRQNLEASVPRACPQRRDMAVHPVTIPYVVSHPIRRETPFNRRIPAPLNMENYHDCRRRTRFRYQILHRPRGLCADLAGSVDRDRRHLQPRRHLAGFRPDRG
jgi:hypothetical protein